jgi:hypothetical protein
VDALSEVFAAVRLSGGVFLNAEFTAPWCVASQVSAEEFGEQGRMPAHLIAYHYIIAGRMLVGVGDAPPLEACAGDIVLFVEYRAAWESWYCRWSYYGCTVCL